MKKILLISLAFTLLTISLVGCSRRDKYQGILDSQYPTDTTEAETPAVMDENTEVDGYKATVIKKNRRYPLL